MREEELQQIADMVVQSMRESGLNGLTREEMIIMRRIIDDYRRTRDRRNKIIDAIIYSLGLAAITATLTGIGHAVKSWLDNMGQ